MNKGPASRIYGKDPHLRRAYRILVDEVGLRQKTSF